MLSAFLLAIGMLCIDLTLNHIDRDAIWIGRDVANIYRDASRRIVTHRDAWRKQLLFFMKLLSQI